MRISSRPLVLVLALFTARLSVFGATDQPIILWPAGAPGDNGNIGEEGDQSKPKDGAPAGKSVIRLGNVSAPTITVYHPPADKDTGAAVVICPGGGYNILAWDLEGTEICEWLNSIGVTGVLLKYRVPTRKGGERYAFPLQDAQRALGITRLHAKDWKLDAKRIGILGFSAGGHLSAVASTNYAERTYPHVDEADDQSCRPDFAVLVYPAYLAGKDEKVAPELKITAETSPTFIVQTEDDPVHIENSLIYYMALVKAKVPAEIHIFPKGGHGYGLRPTDKAVTGWPKLVEGWMHGAGLLGDRH